jgi:assimilatory nitrate reductase catalytic subunit
MIEHDWLDHDFIDNHTTGFEAVAESVREWTPARTAQVTGIAEKAIRQAAEWWGTAQTSFLMHARGIEHHSHGVQNVLGAINIVLASGRIGRPNCGYATITGQANGQGGREHGQKADQLPGARDIDNPEHRAYVAGVWGIDPNDLPPSGVDAYELFRKIDQGEIKGLLSICLNPLVSLPDNNYVRAQLEKLEFYVAIDFFMSETACYAHVVLPGSLQEEDEGVVCTADGRVARINKAVDCPGEARQDWRIIQDLARALGREQGFTFNDPGEIFAELRITSKGGTADYSGITYEKIERQQGVFWPCPAEDHPGTPRLFEPGSWNPVAQGKGPFYFPDGRARFNVATYTPPAEDADLLPRYLCPVDAALLDQHGCGRYHHPGRLDAHPQRRAVVAVAGVAAFSQRIYALFLGFRFVVDPLAPHPGRLAARGQALPVDLRPTVLGHGLPAGYVHRLHHPAGAGVGVALPPGYPAWVYLCCAGRVAGCLCWAGVDACTQPPHSRCSNVK